MLDEVDQTALVLVGLGLLLVGSLVGEDDLEALVEERHRLQPLEHGAGDELGALGGEDRRVGPERDRGAGGATALGRLADDGHLALRLAALGVLLEVALAVAVDLDQQPLGEGVDDADADAVQAAGHLVALPPNLPPAWSTVSTTSAADLPLCGPDGYGSTGMPRPLSSTRQPPSASRVTTIRVQ